MILVDTSCWIEALRKKGNPVVRHRIEQLLVDGEAAWCGIIRLELWSGIGAEPERKVLKQFEQVIPEVPVTDEVWQGACELAARCRAAGKTAPASDILIAACARHHGLQVEHLDHHFDFLLTQ